VGAPESEVWLVRHGETEWSRDHRHTSTTDLPLTARGEEVARGLDNRLGTVDFDVVLTSPRLRARHSAALAGFPDAEVDPDLAEWDYGDYEGITTEQIRESDPGWTVWSHPSPGGESAGQVSVRLDRVVARLRGTAEVEPGPSPWSGPLRRPCLVFGHGHALRALTARWLGLDVREGRLFRLDTATVSVLGYERDQPVVARWNG
jgi:broad specificity phosphatase PhoE